MRLVLWTEKILAKRIFRRYCSITSPWVNKQNINWKNVMHTWLSRQSINGCKLAARRLVSGFETLIYRSIPNKPKRCFANYQNKTASCNIFNITQKWWKPYLKEIFCRSNHGNFSQPFCNQIEVQTFLQTFMIETKPQSRFDTTFFG